MNRVALLLGFFLLFSCNMDKKNFLIEKKPEDFNSLNEWSLYLLELDQNNKDIIELKIEIAKVNILSSQYDKAELYLQSAEALINRKTTDILLYELYSYQAQNSFKLSKWEKSLSYIDKAQSLETPDELLLDLTKAAILKELGEHFKAIELYDKLWSENQADFSENDLQKYFSLLIESEQWNKSLQVLNSYFNTFGYIPGLGINLSIVYENLGMFNESILSVLVELIYQRDYGNITNNEIVERLTLISETQEGSDSIDYISNLKVLFTGNSEFLESDFVNLYTDKNEVFHPFISCLVKFELNDYNEDIFNKYIDFEWVYRSFPSYYYYLWTNMKKADYSYSLMNVQGILEKTIVLAPDSDLSNESRIELGRLLGLTAHQSEKLLMGPEIDSLAYSYMQTENLTILLPALNLLDLPNNEYTDAIVNMFIYLNSVSPKISLFLQENRDRSDQAKLRIDNILNY